MSGVKWYLNELQEGKVYSEVFTPAVYWKRVNFAISKATIPAI